jgi:hypothetical protein
MEVVREVVARNGQPALEIAAVESLPDLDLPHVAQTRDAVGGLARLVQRRQQQRNQQRDDADDDEQLDERESGPCASCDGLRCDVLGFTSVTPV